MADPHLVARLVTAAERMSYALGSGAPHRWPSQRRVNNTPSGTSGRPDGEV